MKSLSNAAVDRLREAVDLPDPGGARYTLIRRLARGGMGAVYLVTDSILERQVAMKVLDTVAESEDFSVRLMREALILARLEHPGIVPIHDAGRLSDGRPYYTMKFVQGRQLDQHVAFLPSLSERLRLFQKICEPVAFAHAHRILHRDLKPSNIMVGSFGEVLVMDWGVAKSLRDEALSEGGGAVPAADKGATLSGTVIGTPAYMSPEQRRGETATLDEQSDVYALGAVLFFLLTDQPPDPEGKGPPPRTIHPSIPKSLEAVCMKACAPDRKLRYGGVMALAADIASFLDGQPVSAYRESPYEIAVRWMGRNRFLLFLVLAYLLMRVLLLIMTGH